MKTITKEAKLMEVERIRQRIIERAEERMAEFMADAQEDFCNFFHWNATDMYELKMKHGYFSNMPQINADADIEAVMKQFKLRIKTIENDLINSSALGSCTSEIINLEHRLKLDAKRAIRETLQNMAYLLDDQTPV